MSARRSPIALVSISLAALATLAAGCAAPTGAPAEGTGEASEAMAYAPLGFARVSASGGVTTSFDSATATTSGVTVAHTAGTGLYVVSFPALAAGYAGNAQVAAEGGDAARCRLVSWLPSSTTQQVTVQCAQPSGANADSAFAVAFLRNTFPATTNTFPTEVAYSYVYNGVAQAAYDHNSSGHHNTVTHPGTGMYSVFIPQATYQNASIMVSAYGGTGAPFCQVGGWGASSGGTSVSVFCWSTTGAPADSAFSIWYSLSGPTMDQQGAHAWFSGGSVSPSYTAGMGKYECDGVAVTGGLVAASNLATITVSGDLGTWDANPFRRASLVSGYGWTPTYCKVPSLTSSGVAPTSTSTTQVRCYQADGTVVAPTFTFTHLTSDASGPC